MIDVDYILTDALRVFTESMSRYQPSSSVRSSAKVGEALEVGVGESGNVEKKEYQAVVEAKKQKVATYASKY